MKRFLEILLICLLFVFTFCFGFLFSSSYKKVVVKEKNCPVNKEQTRKREKTIDINEWINIPTYEKSNETTHPKVLYFDEPVNGYKYWLVSTPYPYNTAFYENPSIVVSNDGIHFKEPEGIKNPISGYPSKYWDESYYSDPYILYDKDHFELFYRKTLSKLNNEYKKSGYNYIYMKTSNDGSNWSKEKLVLGYSPSEAYMSLSVIKENDLYKIWYVNYDNKVKYVTSKDLINYSKPIDINVADFDKKIWHGEVQFINNKYICVFMIKYKLYYTESNDGINFNTPKLINTELNELNGISHNIYKSSFIINDDSIELYIPYRVYDENKKRHIWKMRYVKMSKDKFYNSL